MVEKLIIFVCVPCSEIFEDELSTEESEVIEGKICEISGKIIKR